MPEIKWSLDSICLRGNTVFGHGWVFHPSLEIERIALACADERLPARELVAEYGKSRPDVGNCHPERSQARHSGFIFLGPCAHPAAGLVLRCTLENGTQVQLPIPASLVRNLDEPAIGKDWKTGLRLLVSLVRKAWSLCKGGQYRSLVAKLRRYIGGRPHQHANWVDETARRLQGVPTAIVVDHDLGGGANKYRERYVHSCLEKGGAVLVYSFHVPTLSKQVLLFHGDYRERIVLADTAQLIEVAKKISLTEILYNTGVSFPQPEHLPELLIALKQQTGARLLLTAHDFFMACPSHFLLDYRGAYCGLPDISVCRTCLPANNQGFAPLFRQAEIETWRAAWGAAMAAADEVRCFSNDTRQHLIKAYPLLAQENITVVPHRYYNEALRPIAMRPAASLTIGVIGQIGYHKGGMVVRALADEIARQGLPVKIVVVGEIEFRCDPQVVTQTGGYRANELPDLIERSGIGLILFPSIWPETFSYVVQEIMQMELPVASFDWGAPAERIKDYPRGIILKSQDPQSMLSELIEFSAKLHARN